MNGRRRTFAVLIVLALIPLAALAAGCRYVGSGALNPLPNSSIQEPAAWQGPAVTVGVFRGSTGEAWPPEGKLAFWVRASGFPQIRCGLQCTYLELRRLARADEPNASPPMKYIQYRTCEELINQAGGPMIYWRQPGMELIGNVNIGADGTINQWLLVDDTPDNWNATWVLTDWGYAGLVPIRCGKVIVSPP
jgi:hypothetical protein